MIPRRVIPACIAVLVAISMCGPGSSAGASGLQFGAPLESHTAYQNGGLAAGDLNRDGKVDLVVAHGGGTPGNNVSVLLGGGDGTFSLGGVYPVGYLPVSIAIADFDEDGAPDLVVTNAGDGTGTTISLLFGNGDGTFKPSTSMDVPNYPWIVTASDLNHDGHADIVVDWRPNYGDGGIVVFLGNGDGTFRARLDYGAHGGPVGHVVADLNGDGHPDIAAANYRSYDISVLLGNGDGTFRPRVDFPAGRWPRTVAAGDLNQDGIPDLVTSNSDDNTLSILYGNGNGTFQTPLAVDGGPNPYKVIAVDFDRDGVLDLAASHHTAGFASVWQGLGGGAFGSRVDLALGGGSNSVCFIEVASLNCGTTPDLAASLCGTTTVGVFPNLHSAPCSIQASSPLRGFWPLDEASCSVAGDSSGGGHAGEIVAGASVPGRFGGGLSFDGSGGVGFCSSLPFDVTGRALTLTAWVMPSAAAQGKCNMIVAKGREYYSTGGFQLAYDWGGLNPQQPQPRIYGGVYVDGSPNVSAVTYDVQLPTDRYSHIAFTYDGVAMRLYLDGVEVATAPLTGMMTSDTESNLTIGSFAYVPNHYPDIGCAWRGAIDEIAIWDVVRCPALLRRDATTSLVGRTDELCPPEEVDATVDIAPKTLNLSSAGRFVTAYIEIPGEFSPSDIVASSVRLSGSIPAMPKPVIIGDRDGDGVPDLMVKFNRQDLGSLPLGPNTLEVSGKLISGQAFAGSSTINVIDPSASSSAAMSVRITSPMGRAPVELTIESPRSVLHTVSIFDVQGRIVRRWSEPVSGYAATRWDGLRPDGSRAGSGIYFIEVRAGDLARTSRAAIVR